jgi:Family of unknown function (DUF5678)
MSRSTKHESKMRWLGENEALLESRFPGKWVAIADYGLVGVGDTLEEAETQALGNGEADPLLTGIKGEDYQNVYVIRGWR